MIIGIGSDIVDIRRIEAALTRHGERFLSRLFTTNEQARARASLNPAATLAKRFAAKEACAKAMGTGMTMGVRFRDIEVVNNAGGAPSFSLTGGAAARLAALTPAGGDTHMHLSLSDDKPMALAFVVIESIETR